MPDVTMKASAEPCAWVNCRAADAVAAYNDVEVFPEGSSMRVKVGRVALCEEHMLIFTRERRLQIAWDRILEGESCPS